VVIRVQRGRDQRDLDVLSPHRAVGCGEVLQHWPLAGVAIGSCTTTQHIY